MARTSVRDLYAARVAPSEAGGDFASEARRLGSMTARMHLALAQAFDREDGSVPELLSNIEAHVEVSAPDWLSRDNVTDLFSDLRSAGGRFVAVRSHGCTSATV